MGGWTYVAEKTRVNQAHVVKYPWSGTIIQYIETAAFMTHISGTNTTHMDKIPQLSLHGKMHLQKYIQAYCPKSKCTAQSVNAYIKPLSSAVDLSHCSCCYYWRSALKGIQSHWEQTRINQLCKQHVTSSLYLFDRDQKARKHPTMMGV